MPSTIACSFGDVVLVPFPFTDQTFVKKRPAVVVSSAAYHRHRVDVVVMAVTSRTSPTAAAMGEVIVMEWEKAGLLIPSTVKPVLATLERRLIVRRLGELQQQDRDAVRGALQQILG
jgi:mRNA-degrading endonuclease toxin of MazEF toxin-antitoxin module